MIADVLGTIVFDLLFAPAEWMLERLWRLHRKEPFWRRAVGGTLLVLASAVVIVLYIAVLVGIPLGIYWLVTQSR